MKPSFGVINFEDRYKQTLETFDSIKAKDQEAFIVFSDSSVYPLTNEEKSTIRQKVNLCLDFSQDEYCKQFNQFGLKSHGENYMLLKTMETLKVVFDFSELDGRMFKLGGRCKLQDEFDVTIYENIGSKYVFKKRLNSWMPKSTQDLYGSTHILETRLYSWDFSLIDDYMEVIKRNFESFGLGLDTEHSHLLNIDPDKLVELDTLHCECVMALTGQTMLD